MQETDKLFIQEVSRLTQHNAEHPKERQALHISRSVLSSDLLELMGVERTNHTGVWFMGVYVVFQPLFTAAPATDWQ